MIGPTVRVVLLVALLVLLVSGAAGGKKKKKQGQTETVTVTPTGDATPASSGIDEAEISALYNKLLLGNGKKPGKAVIHNLQDAVAASPSNAMAQAALGQAKLMVGKKGDDKAGVRHLRAALEVAPTLPGVHMVLADALHERVQRDASDRFSHKEAVETYTTALRLAPASSTAAYFQLGTLHGLRDGKDRMGKALDGYNHSKHVGSDDDVVAPLWRTAVQLAPADWRPPHALSARLIQSTKKSLRKEAIALAETAAELAPQRATLHANLAGAHLRLNRPMATGRLKYEDAVALGLDTLAHRQAAIRALSRCVRADREKHVHFDAHWDLGMLLYTVPPAKGREGTKLLDDLKMSHRHFQHALELRPDDSEAARFEQGVRSDLARGKPQMFPDVTGDEGDDDEDD